MSQSVETVFKGPLADGHVVLRTFANEFAGSASRAKERNESRLALSTALIKLGLPIDLSDADFKEYQQIRGSDEVRFSISHTRQAAGCWAIRQPRLAVGIGFDMERSDRELSTAATSRILSPDDDRSLNAIQLWCAKEAVFKSLPSGLQSDVTLPKIQIVSSTRFLVTSLKLEGALDLNLTVKNMTLAFAWIPL